MDLIEIARGLSPADSRALSRGENVFVPQIVNGPDEDILRHTLRFVCATLNSKAFRLAGVQETLGVIAENAPQNAEAKRAMTALRAILDYQEAEQTELVATLRRLKAAKAPLIDPDDFIAAMRVGDNPGNEKMAHWLDKAFRIADKNNGIA
ncbi:hypothetical protein [Acetobacter oryzifermentans]|uniref:Uncharacterized protein n=1 Tax=Acetobacter oryzifermentans TaxID=1633874 RepID=A0ABM6AK48_9PROT|nr:hypothetical protein [Acetobacter oryzifermentans]ANA14152.1 hypothetical protein WG31_09165 [Acetobacter oryzifermentans]